MTRLSPLLCCLCLLCFLSSCNGVGARVAELEDKNQALERKVQEQNTKLESMQATIDQQKQQIDSLLRLGPGRLEMLYHVNSVELDGLSGGYDADDKPGDDGIKVYLRPKDQDGDIVKAAGGLEIQLLDLANPPTQQVVAEFRWLPADARKLWYSKFLTNHYTLECPWPNGVPPKHANITIRAIFHDILQGKRFETQKLVEVKLPPR